MQFVEKRLVRSIPAEVKKQTRMLFIGRGLLIGFKPLQPHGVKVVRSSRYYIGRPRRRTQRSLNCNQSGIGIVWCFRYQNL